MDSRRLFRTSAVAMAGAGLLITGCSSTHPGSRAASASPASAVSPSAGKAAPGGGAGTVDQAALKKYYAQKLSWHACGPAGFQCSTMKAPLDYTKPKGTEIKLAVAREKATGPGKRLGS